MPDTFQMWPQIRARLRAGPFASHLDPIIDGLTKRGYARTSIRLDLHVLDVLGTWLTRRGIPASAINEATIARFVGGLVRHPSRARPRGRMPEIGCRARRIATVLWEDGIASRDVSTSAPTDLDQWLQSFDNHLWRVSGLSAGTRCCYLRFARAFLSARFGTATLAWSFVTADDLTTFVTVQAARLSPSGSRLPVTSMRAMLRFLVASGAVRAGLEGAVPTVRQWKLASLPRYLTAEEVDRVLVACGEGTAVRRRDRAALLLLVRLGMRAGEVAQLGLDDIDWRSGQLVVRTSKSGRQRKLPLLNEVGRAIADYLRGGRPDRPDRAMFLGCRPPFRRLTSGAVTAIAKAALRRAGVTVAHPGAHAFRHTAATQMLRRGATFKQIADVLGHACLTTTAIYAKLDLLSLARIALPWPEGAR